MQEERDFSEKESKVSGRFGSINSLKREALMMMMNLHFSGD